MTHPFHPLAGREFPLLEIRTLWSGERAYGRRPDGRALSIPLSWTSLAAPDPFVVMAAGRSRLRLAELLELATLVKALASASGPGGAEAPGSGMLRK